MNKFNTTVHNSCSENEATGSYPEPDGSNPYYTSIYAQFQQVVMSSSSSDENFVRIYRLYHAYFYPAHPNLGIIINISIIIIIIFLLTYRNLSLSCVRLTGIVRLPGFLSVYVYIFFYWLF